jgi:acetylornithine deacetylase/succinyl-diaminopimelate desuccinylase-like protein
MRLSVIAFACAATIIAASARSQTEAQWNALARELMAELIQINTTDTPAGNNTLAAEAMAKRLLAGGYAPEDVQVLGPMETKKNLVVRLRGSGKQRPILLLGHLDVVEALRSDWTTDPFQLVEKDGYFYGRGTLDMKSGIAIMVVSMLRLKKEGFRPGRDLILALTADEESGPANGIDWLLKKHRPLVDAEYVINHDNSSILSNAGVPEIYELSASEKLYADFQVSATHPGGHSSLPVPENPIHTLAEGLARLAKHRFPFELNNVTRGYYERMARVARGQRAADMRAILRDPPDTEAIERLSRDPLDNATFRTTCVATRVSAGHANNALPQTATATVNCRILPGHSPEGVRNELVRVLADERLTVRYIDFVGKVVDKAPLELNFAPPPLRPDLMQPLTKLVQEFWPGLEVVPSMSVGATDAVYTSAAGIPSFVVTGIAVDRDDDRTHGKDERLRVATFYQGNEFFYRLLKMVSASSRR